MANMELMLVPAGMGVPTVTAARILKGQLSGHSGEETQLEMDKFPFVSLAKVCHLLLWCHAVWDSALILQLPWMASYMVFDRKQGQSRGQGQVIHLCG